MRVLHILNELRPSGAETMLRVAAAHWQNEGIVCEILSTGEQPGDYATALESAGYRVHHLPFRRSVAFLAGVYAFLRRERCDVVHIHSERANVWYATLAALAGQRHIVRSVHSTFRFHGALRARRTLQRWWLRRILGVRTLAAGPSVARVEQEVFSNPCQVCLSWFDDNRFAPPDEATRLAARAAFGINASQLALLSVGNCAAVKNHTTLLEALARLPASLDWVYLHVGSSPEEPAEQALASRLGVAPRCRFLGARLDVERCCHAADLALTPSLYEGLGVASLEAMATGLPVILADVEGLRDLHALAQDAVLVPPSAVALAAAIERFAELGQPTRRAIGERLSSAVRSLCGAAAGAGRYSAVYREMTGLC